MRHFTFLTDDERVSLFFRAPCEFDRDADRDTIASALGATLYSPANRPHLATDLVSVHSHGALSSVLCLEDAVPDEEVAQAEKNLVTQLEELFTSGATHPLIFVRPRSPHQIVSLVDELGGQAKLIDGFVLPKFDSVTGPAFLDVIERASADAQRAFWVMPILESPAVLDRESRVETLLGIKELLATRNTPVLSYRIGATDLSALIGIRRPPELAAYDIAAVASVIGDIVNVFCRVGRGGLQVSGPVWEYFEGYQRLLKPQLRETPFRKHESLTVRSRLISRGLDGLIREVFLDQANGLIGKSVIHPSHIAVVHALSVVTHEEYVDATDLVADPRGGGARASAYSNKMNEGSPHQAWAQAMLRRARAFGVAHSEVSFADLLEASVVR